MPSPSPSAINETAQVEVNKATSTPPWWRVCPVFNTNETLHPDSRGNLRRRVVVFTSNSLILMNPLDYNAYRSTDHTMSASRAQSTV